MSTDSKEETSSLLNTNNLSIKISEDSDNESGNIQRWLATRL